MRRMVTFVLALALCPWVAAEQVGDEVKAEVPALFALHDVVAPLWHDAWPNKKTEMMKELLPQVETGVKAVAAAELPGILRDKKEAWLAGVGRLQAAVAAYQKAVAEDQAQAMLDAVEDLHSEYEGLIRVVRPPMKELDAYHQVLYTLYHHEMPSGDLAAVRAAAAELGRRCQVLVTAPLPRRAKGREQLVTESIAALCRETAALEALPADAGRDAVEAAVERVHTGYRAAEDAFGGH